MRRALLLLLAFTVPYVWNSWNLTTIRDTGNEDKMLRMDRTVATADDVSYLAPVNDQLGEWGLIPATGRAVKAEFRTPGYGLWYLVLHAVLTEQQALGMLRVVQTLLFALALLLLSEVMEAYDIRTSVRMTIVYLYIAMPLFHGFLFYTLTEAVTPALSVMVLCCALLYARVGDRSRLMAGLAIWSLLILTRPVLAWVGVPILVAMVQRNGSTIPWKRMLGAATMVALPTLLWWGVNMQRYDGWLSLHPVYLPEAGSVYRPTHKAFWELGKSWGLRGDRFHSIMEPAFHTALECDTSERFAEAFVASAPAGDLDDQAQRELQRVFRDWQRFTCNTHSGVRDDPKLFARGPIAEEQELVRRIEAITVRYRSEHWFRYGVLAPLGVLRAMTVHSNLNLFLFQHTYRGHWWMEILRWCSLLLHLALIVALLATAILSNAPILRTMAILALLYIAYLAWGQRGIEERYTLPVIHLAMVMAPFLFQRLWMRWQQSAPR